MMSWISVLSSMMLFTSPLSTIVIITLSIHFLQAFSHPFHLLKITIPSTFAALQPLHKVHFSAEIMWKIKRRERKNSPSHELTLSQAPRGKSIRLFSPSFPCNKCQNCCCEARKEIETQTQFFAYYVALDQEREREVCRIEKKKKRMNWAACKTMEKNMKKIPCEKSVCDKEGEGKNQFANLSYSCDEEGFGELISRFEPACRTLLCCFSRLEYFQEEKKKKSVFQYAQSNGFASTEISRYIC